MYCKNCGVKSNEGQKFCTNCGNVFSHTVEQEVKNNTEHLVKRHKKSSWDVSRIIGIIIVLCLVGIGAYNSQDKEVIDKNNKAMVNFDSGNKDQAISGFQDASKNAATTENKITTLKNLGYVYAGDTRPGQKELAIETFKQALALTTQDTFDYYLIAGEIAMLEDKPNSAIIAYNKAYEKNPNDFQINNALTLFYLNVEDNANDYVDYKKAVQYGERTVQLSDLQLAKENLGLAYYFNEDYDKAISTFSKLSSTKPTNAYFIGLSYAAKKDPVNAKLYLNKAIAGGQVVPQEVTDYINSH
jgi:tetratricopeptide (TPR) repeat protein